MRQTEARFLPANTNLTKFYGLTAAEQAEHEAKLNEKRKENHETELEPMFTESTDITVEVTVGGQTGQTFVVKQASVVPVNLRVRQQEDQILRVKDVLLFSPTGDRDLGVNVITPAFSLVKKGANKASLVVSSSTDTDATLTSGDLLGTARLVDAAGDNTFIAVSAEQGEMVTSLFKSRDWPMDTESGMSSKALAKAERNKKRLPDSDEADTTGSKKAKLNKQHKNKNAQYSNNRYQKYNNSNRGTRGNSRFTRPYNGGNTRGRGGNQGYGGYEGYQQQQPMYQGGEGDGMGMYMDVGNSWNNWNYGGYGMNDYGMYMDVGNSWNNWNY